MTHVPLEQKRRGLDETLQALPLRTGRRLLPQSFPDFVCLPIIAVVEEVTGVEKGLRWSRRARGAVPVGMP